MPPGQYPTPDIGGPPIAIFQRLPDECVGLVTRIMKDGGISVGAESTNVILRWGLTYADQGQGYLTPAEALSLDTHVRSAIFSSAVGFSLYGFSFRDPRTLVLYSDVHYETYEYPEHVKIAHTARHVVLVKRPN